MVLQPGCAQVGISQISIPLAWNRDQHFKSKGEIRTFSLFVTIRCGEDIIDSKLVTSVDRTVTDVLFKESFIFANQADDFCVEIDVFAARTDDLDHVGGSIRQKITRSLGRKLGQSTKQKLTVGEEALKASLHTAPQSLGSTQYNLLARAQLAITDAGDEPKVHDLKPRAFADLCGPPLYGSIVCRLAVQPHSVIAPIADGVLTVIPADQHKLYQMVRATLQSGRLRCFSSETLSLPSVSEEKLVLEIVLNAGTKLARTSRQDELILTTSTSAYGEGKRYYMKTAEDSLDAWHTAFEQQIADCVSWGVFAYSTHSLTRETKQEPETIGRSAGKRFYDQIDINSTLPRQFGTSSSYLKQMASSSFTRNTPPASVLSLSPMNGVTSNHHTAPARRSMLRPSVMNVFSENPVSMIRTTEIGAPSPSSISPKSPLVSAPRPYTPNPQQRVHQNAAMKSIYYEPPEHSIYATDARKYAAVFEERRRVEPPAILVDPRGESHLTTVQEEGDKEENNKYVIRLTVGTEGEDQGYGSYYEAMREKNRTVIDKPLPVIRSSSPAAAYAPQPKPRTKYALKQSASERDARFPTTFFRDTFPNQIQITRL